MMWQLLLVLTMTAIVQSDAPVVWGGDHVEMEVTARGARLDFDCAHGTIDQPLKTDAKGKFSLQGTFTAERGGPQREGDERGAKATYSGSIDKDTMHLTIVLASDKTDTQQYVLVRNQRGNVFKCR